jgi:hypothetical protein
VAAVAGVTLRNCGAIVMLGIGANATVAALPFVAPAAAVPGELVPVALAPVALAPVVLAPEPVDVAADVPL